MRKPVLHERTSQLDWEDLQTVLAVARAGSLAGAARALDVQHSTVFRRIEAAEQRLRVRLFERARSGWYANAHGEVVAAAARVMEEAALKAERHVLGADVELTGSIRVATSELLGGYLLQRPLAEFLATHPGIVVEIDVANRQVDLTRREADFAVRATATPPDSLIGRRVGELCYAVYVAPRCLPPNGSAPDLAALPWIGFDERMSQTAIGRWFATTFPSAEVRLRSDSFATILRLAIEGIGAVVLPVFAAANEPGLLRITPPIPDQSMGLWLLNHPDVRSNARVTALARHLVAAIPRELARLMDCGARPDTLATCPRPASRQRSARKRGRGRA
jgi:DNA-binding transcriptional LysR family regulator